VRGSSTSRESSRLSRAGPHVSERGGYVVGRALSLVPVLPARCRPRRSAFGRRPRLWVGGLRERLVRAEQNISAARPPICVRPRPPIWFHARAATRSRCCSSRRSSRLFFSSVSSVPIRTKPHAERLSLIRTPQKYKDRARSRTYEPSASAIRPANTRNTSGVFAPAGKIGVDYLRRDGRRFADRVPVRVERLDLDDGWCGVERDRGVESIPGDGGCRS
jgi:hypothetical protein